MRDVSKAFINERGNPIVAQVKDEVDGQVLIALESPTSVSENIVTLREAEVLYKLLGTYLQVRRFMGD